MITDIRALYTGCRPPTVCFAIRFFLLCWPAAGHAPDGGTSLRQMLEGANLFIRQQALPAGAMTGRRKLATAGATLQRACGLCSIYRHGAAYQPGAQFRQKRRLMQLRQAMRRSRWSTAPDDAGRGHRDGRWRSCGARITGAEDACIVNNNAAAECC